MTVVGRKDPVRLFELIDAMPPERQAVIRSHLDVYAGALNSFYAKDFRAAVQGFTKFLDHVPGDVVAGRLKARAQTFMRVAPDTNWTGVHNLRGK